MNDSPCKPDCPKRNGTCHSICPDYKKWRDKKDKENEQINKQKQADWNYTNSRIKYAIKSAKRRGAMK